MVELLDTDGRVRLRLAVTPDGSPKIEFFNADGERTGYLPGGSID